MVQDRAAPVDAPWAAYEWLQAATPPAPSTVESPYQPARSFAAEVELHPNCSRARPLIVGSTPLFTSFDQRVTEDEEAVADLTPECHGTRTVAPRREPCARRHSRTLAQPCNHSPDGVTRGVRYSSGLGDSLRGSWYSSSGFDVVWKSQPRMSPLLPDRPRRRREGRIHERAHRDGHNSRRGLRGVEHGRTAVRTEVEEGAFLSLV